MSRDKQMINDLIEIFDEEYGKINLITPQNTAEKMTAKGYRKASEVAREVIDDCIDILNTEYRKCDTNDVKIILAMVNAIAELKKKYTEEGK